MTEKQVWIPVHIGGERCVWIRSRDPRTAQHELRLNKKGLGHVPYRVIVTPKPARPQWTEHEIAALIEQGMAPCPR